MSKVWMRTTTLTAVCAAAILVAACDWAPRLEVRTFPLENLRAVEAANLIEPYVYGTREGAEGMTSLAEGAITVRETRDNLDRIAEVLAEMDRPQADARLHFQLIEADGFTDADERIADVERELRKILQFRGYRLAGEAFVTATDASEIMQGLRTSDGLFEIRSVVHRFTPGVIRLEGVSLYSDDSPTAFSTTVNIRPGQTIVLGSSPKTGSTATLLLTVRADQGPGPD